MVLHLRYTECMTKEAPRTGATARTQVNVRLPQATMEELMRLGGLEQAVTGVRATQQNLVEQAVEDLVVKLRAKHAQQGRR